jgi:hypothetical protein
MINPEKVRTPMIELANEIRKVVRSYLQPLS